MSAAVRPPSLSGRVFRGRDAVAAGLLTRKQLASQVWRRLYRDVYADAALADTHQLAITGATLLAPPSAVFAGRSAAYLLGAESLVDQETPVELIVPEAARFGPVTGLRIRRAALVTTEVRSVGRLFCTTPVRTALDLARREDLADAVVVLDVFLARGLIDPQQLGDAVSLLTAVRGSRKARQAIALADERAESPPESRLRLLLRLAGLAPVPQYVVRDADGRFIARVDLAFPELRIAIEYDGAWHGQPGQLGRDRRRLNGLVAVGWTVLHVTASDMHEPELLVSAVRQLIAERERGVVALSRVAEKAISPRSAQITDRARGS